MAQSKIGEAQTAVAQAKYQAGLDNLAVGLYDDAIEYFRVALDLNPDHPLAGQALTDAETARNTKAYADARYSTGINNLDAGNYDNSIEYFKEAIKYFEKVLDLNEGHQATIDAKTLAQSKIGEALIATAQAKYDAGQKNLEADDYRQAIDYFEKAIEYCNEGLKFKPNDQDANDLIGLAQSKIGEAHTEAAQAKYDAGLVKFRAGLYGKAILDFKAVLLRKSDYPLAKKSYQNAQKANHFKGKADAKYQEGLDNLADNYDNAILAFKAAIRHFEKVLALNEGHQATIDAKTLAETKMGEAQNAKNAEVQQAGSNENGASGSAENSDGGDPAETGSAGGQAGDQAETGTGDNSGGVNPVVVENSGGGDPSGNQDGGTQEEEAETSSGDNSGGIDPVETGSTGGQGRVVVTPALSNPVPTVRKSSTAPVRRSRSGGSGKNHSPEARGIKKKTWKIFRLPTFERSLKYRFQKLNGFPQTDRQIFRSPAVQRSLQTRFQKLKMILPKVRRTFGSPVVETLGS